VRSFESIIEQFGSALARAAAAYERNLALRQELLQEIHLALFRSLPQLKEAAKLRPFVFRIAHNCCVDHVIRHAHGARRTDIPEELPSDAPTPDEELMVGERTRRLVEAVRRLELPYRQVITLLLEDMTYMEIAETLGLTLTNVGVRVNRAKARLRELLKHE
jgi:RNA polymerase sigma-70 factor (ECF subfamily)